MLKTLKTSQGFTLVEVMIVVAIIGVLASMAVPNFITSRQAAQRATCLGNMRTLQGCAALAAFDGVMDQPDPESLPVYFGEDELVPEYLQCWPVCPFVTDIDGGYTVEVTDGTLKIDVWCANYNSDYHIVPNPL